MEREIGARERMCDIVEIWDAGEGKPAEEVIAAISASNWDVGSTRGRSLVRRGRSPVAAAERRVLCLRVSLEMKREEEEAAHVFFFFFASSWSVDLVCFRRDMESALPFEPENQSCVVLDSDVVVVEGVITSSGSKISRKLTGVSGRGM